MRVIYKVKVMPFEMCWQFVFTDNSTLCVRQTAQVLPLNINIFSESSETMIFLPFMNNMEISL